MFVVFTFVIFTRSAYFIYLSQNVSRLLRRLTGNTLVSHIHTFSNVVTSVCRARYLSHWLYCSPSYISEQSAPGWLQNPVTLLCESRPCPVIQATYVQMLTCVICWGRFMVSGCVNHKSSDKPETWQKRANATVTIKLCFVSLWTVGSATRLRHGSNREAISCHVIWNDYLKLHVTLSFRNKL